MNTDLDIQKEQSRAKAFQLEMMDLLKKHGFVGFGGVVNMGNGISITMHMDAPGQDNVCQIFVEQLKQCFSFSDPIAEADGLYKPK